MDVIKKTTVFPLSDEGGRLTFRQDGQLTFVMCP